MATQCKPGERALKSFFVGPQAENAGLLYSEIKMVLDSWIDWRKEYYPNDGSAISRADQAHPEFQKKIKEMRTHTKLLLEMFSKEIPKFSPRYLGHMFSEISMPALIGHIIALIHNPNNISRESSWVGVDLEKKAIQKLCQMVGYSKASVGHFTSGGTIANFEAILRAKSKVINYLLLNSGSKGQFNDACYLNPLRERSDQNIKTEMGDIDLYKFINQKFKIDFDGFTIIVPDSRHYSWTKGSSLFGLGKNNLTKVQLNKYGQISSYHLQKKIDDCLIKKRPILCIASVCGTTELGTIDPIDKVNTVLEKYKKNYGYNFWHHIDAAYGGFFSCMKDNDLFKDQTKNALKALKHSTSITIDPHKLGYVPYASGVFMCRDPKDYYVHEISAPYVDFELEQDSGPYTIEGSRPATGAAALYMSSECIGLNKKGYGKILERTICASKRLQYEFRKNKAPLLFVETVGTNIVCFAIGKQGDKLTTVNKKTKCLLKEIMSSKPSQEKNNFFVSKTTLGENYKDLITHFCRSYALRKDCAELLLVRLTVMNPFVQSINSKTDYLSEFIRYIQLHISEH